MQCTADFTVLPTGLPTFSVGKCTASGDFVFPSETREGFSGGSSKVQIQTLRNNVIYDMRDYEDKPTFQSG